MFKCCWSLEVDARDKGGGVGLGCFFCAWLVGGPFWGLVGLGPGMLGGPFFVFCVYLFKRL